MPPEGAASFALVDEGFALGGGLKEWGLFDVSSWDTLSLRLDMNASGQGPYFLTVNWFSAINGGRGIPIAQRNVMFEDGDAVFWSWPNFGSAVGIIITPTGGGPYAGGINLTARRNSLHTVPARDLEITGDGVIAPATFRFNTAAVAANGGWANWEMANSAAGATAHGIQYLGGAGVWRNLTSIELPINATSLLVWIPQRKIRTFDFNRGAAGQNIRSTLLLS